MNTDRFKFRVWDKLNEEYVEDQCEECSIRFDGNLNIRVYCDDGYTGHYESYEPHEVIIEQCTGLRDKNRTLIYDGDIVIKKDTNALGYGRTRKCTVHWQQDWAEWAITTEFGDTYALAEFAPERLEIIGNIHEQKEQK